MKFGLRKEQRRPARFHRMHVVEPWVIAKGVMNCKPSKNSVDRREPITRWGSEKILQTIKVFGRA